MHKSRKFKRVRIFRQSNLKITGDLVNQAFDLYNGLVVAQTRRIGGKRFDEHHNKLLLTIEAGLLSLPSGIERDCR